MEGGGSTSVPQDEMKKGGGEDEGVQPWPLGGEWDDGRNEGQGV